MNTSYHKFSLGVLCKILALSCFCIFSLGFEHSTHSNISTIAQFSLICLLGVIILLPVVVLFFSSQLKKATITLYPLRALVSIAGMVTWIEAVKHLGSTESILVNYLTPIIAILLASFIKLEKLNINCLFLGLLGYIIVAFSLKTEIEVASYGFVMAVVSSVLWAAYELICKKQTNSEHLIIQVFYTFYFAAIFLLPFSLSSLMHLDLSQIIIFCSMSILRILNVVLLFLSIKLATLNWLLPISYIKFVLMAFWGFVLHNTIPKTEHFFSAILLVMLLIITSKLKKNTENF